MDVLKRLKSLQKEYGWSDYRTAKEAGLASSTISNIYKRNTLPNVITLEAICKGFGITLSQFFSENDTKVIELTPETEKLFHKWLDLSDDKKSIVIQLMDALK